MSDNPLQVDQSGSNYQRARVYLGPSLGWAEVPVINQTLITSAAALTLSPYSSRVILKAAVKAIALPSVAQWMNATLPQGNNASFDRSIWIKDLAYQASSGAPIVITPNGSDTIDALATFSIITPGALIRLFGLTDLTGWYVG